MEWTQEERIDVARRILLHIINSTSNKDIQLDASVAIFVLTHSAEELDLNILEIDRARGVK